MVEVQVGRTDRIGPIGLPVAQVGEILRAIAIHLSGQRIDQGAVLAVVEGIPGCRRGAMYDRAHGIDVGARHAQRGPWIHARVDDLHVLETVDGLLTCIQGQIRVQIDQARAARGKPRVVPLVAIDTDPDPEGVLAVGTFEDDQLRLRIPGAAHHIVGELDRQMPGRIGITHPSCICDDGYVGNSEADKISVRCAQRHRGIRVSVRGRSIVRAHGKFDDLVGKGLNAIREEYPLIVGRLIAQRHEVGKRAEIPRNLVGAAGNTPDAQVVHVGDECTVDIAQIGRSQAAGGAFQTGLRHVADAVDEELQRIAVGIPDAREVRPGVDRKVNRRRGRVFLAANRGEAHQRHALGQLQTELQPVRKRVNPALDQYGIHVREPGIDPQFNRPSIQIEPPVGAFVAFRHQVIRSLDVEAPRVLRAACVDRTAQVAHFFTVGNAVVVRVGVARIGAVQFELVQV